MKSLVKDRSMGKSADWDGWTSATVIHSKWPKAQTRIRMPRTNKETVCVHRDRRYCTQTGEQTQEGQGGGWRVRRPALTFTLGRWWKVKHSGSPCVWGRQRGIHKGRSLQEKEWRTKKEKKKGGNRRRNTKNKQRNVQSCRRGTRRADGTFISDWRLTQVFFSKINTTSSC